ncbi:MAG: response regulator receiver, partial [Nocardioides sp.]|nr:response regulator receiver [Nocardioides sp.]
MSIRVLLVDDAAPVRRLVRTALRFRGGFEVVGEAGTGGEAVELARDLQPDVVVLDLGLPDIAGRDVLTHVRDSSPSSAVVIFSGTEPVDRAWFDDHAAGYVLKDVELDYLVDLLEAVSRPRADSTAIDLPHDPASVLLARRFVREQLTGWQL